MGVRLRRGTFILSLHTHLVDIPTRGAGPRGGGHGLAMTESQEAGDKHLIRLTSSAHGATHGLDINGAAA